MKNRDESWYQMKENKKLFIVDSDSIGQINPGE